MEKKVKTDRQFTKVISAEGRKEGGKEGGREGGREGKRGGWRECE